MYCGDILLKNLKMFTHIHYATLSLVGSQFFFNKFIYTYRGLLSRFKQNLIYIYFGMFGSSLTVVCLKRGTKQNRHSHSVAGSKNCTVNDVKAVLKSFPSGKEILVSY